MRRAGPSESLTPTRRMIPTTRGNLKLRRYARGKFEIARVTFRDTAKMYRYRLENGSLRDDREIVRRNSIGGVRGTWQIAENRKCR